MVPKLMRMQQMIGGRKSGTMEKIRAAGLELSERDAGWGAVQNQIKQLSTRSERSESGRIESEGDCAMEGFGEDREKTERRQREDREKTERRGDGRSANRFIITSFPFEHLAQKGTCQDRKEASVDYYSGRLEMMSMSRVRAKAKAKSESRSRVIQFHHRLP